MWELSYSSSDSAASVHVLEQHPQSLSLLSKWGRPRQSQAGPKTNEIKGKPPFSFY